MNTIIGNITSLIANLLDAYSATKKEKKNMLKIQCISVIFYVITNALLNAYSTVVQNLCSLVRNFLAAKETESKIVEYIIVLVALVLGIYFNNLGAIGLLPVFGNVEYSICLFLFKKNVRAIKISYLICNICFLILNYFISNYVGLIFTFITVLTLIVEILKKGNN